MFLLQIQFKLRRAPPSRAKRADMPGPRPLPNRLSLLIPRRLSSPPIPMVDGHAERRATGEGPTLARGA